MQLVRLAALSERQWHELTAAEPEPWGGGVAEDLSWREKTRHVGVLAPEGRLLAVAGATLAELEVEGTHFEVLGVGGVFVTPGARGRGLAGRLLEALLGGGEPGAPERAMLFCRAPLMALYAKHGFREISDPVWAQQPGGRIEMPLRAMWRALSAGVTWPAGRVEVRGLPF